MRTRIALRPDATLLALLVGGLVVALHLRGLPGSFLSDDLGHLVTVARVDRDGKLGSWLLERFIDSLHNGNFAYRPMLFLSYAADWRMFGANASAAHVENLVLHLANAALAGALAFRWSRIDASAAALVAAAAFAAFPLAGEVSFWVVGRANLLAALFGLLFLLALGDTHERSTSPLRHGARIACLYAALLSNESAMPLPLMATIVVVFGRTVERAQGNAVEALRRRVAAASLDLAIVWIAFAAYLGWRTWLFGTPMRVYEGMPVAWGVGEWIERIGTLVESVGRQVMMQPTAAWPLVFAALAIVLAALAWRSRTQPPARAAIVAFAIAAILYLAIAVATVGPAGHGEGVRNYYLPWIFAACAIGMAAARSRGAHACAIVLVGWLLIGQEGSLRQWQSAAASMRAVTRAVPQLAATIEPRQFAAVLLPQRIGSALFARNAQAAIFMWPVQRVDYLHRMVGMTEWDVEFWPALLANDGLAALRGQPLAIDDFVGVFCFSVRRDGFVRVWDGGAVPDARWSRALRANAAAADCLPML